MDKPKQRAPASWCYNSTRTLRNDSSGWSSAQQVEASTQVQLNPTPCIS